MAGPGEPRVDLAELIDRLVAESGGAVTALRRFPARPAQTVPIPDTIDPRLADALRRARDRGALHAPGRGARRPRQGRPRGRRDADGVRQDALLQPPGPPGAPDRAGDAGPLPLPHEGARAGPAGGARGAGAGAAGAADPHLRRGHAAGRAARRPGPRQRGADEPGHAPLGDPAAPHEVDRALPESALRRHRRAPHLPRRLRQPPRQRAPPAPADLPALRGGAPVHLHVGDDRQPPGARGAARRGAGGPGRRRTARPPARRSSSSTTRRSSTPSSGSAGRT